VMKCLILTFCFIFLSCAIVPRFRKQNERELAQLSDFEQWMGKFNKVYASGEEKQLRFSNYKATLERVTKKNQMSKGARYGPTKFADMSPEEFKDKILMKNKIVPPTNEEKRANLLTIDTEVQLEQQFDWRNLGGVTAVKDQEQCGSCWAFSTTENIESVWMLNKKISNKTMPGLAPQQIVDCDTSDDGCGGGFPTTAYEYVINAGGLEPQIDYPYTAEDGSCTFKSGDVYAKISNWKYGCSDENEAQMNQNLQSWAPLSICLDAANWQDYTSGVMTAWECAWINELDHCVQAVGINSAASTPYWIVRNSWGTDWGVNGYIWLEYGANTCGLTQMVTTSVL